MERFCLYCKVFFIFLECRSILTFIRRLILFTFSNPTNFISTLSTFVCPTEIIAYSDRAAEFSAIGCQLIGCSTDSHFTHLAWINTERKNGGLGKLSYPLLADKNMNIARNYGVLDEETGIPFRGLFIIDRAQNLRQITINDLPVGRSVDETLRLVQAFQVRWVKFVEMFLKQSIFESIVWLLALNFCHSLNSWL